MLAADHQIRKPGRDQNEKLSIMIHEMLYQLLPTRFRRFLRKSPLRKWILQKLPAGSRQDDWQKRWGNLSFSPAWLLTQSSPPLSLQVAIDTQWFAAGSSVLDIGCGWGAISAWLADKGYRVVGIDFASSAVEKARSIYSPKESGGPRFRVVDISQEQLDLPGFDCLFDRGCFHGIPTSQITGYVRNVAACLGQGGKFLLLHKDSEARLIGNEPKSIERNEVDEKIRRYFDEFFEVANVESINMMATPDSDPTPPRMGRVYWMIRR